MSTSNEQTIGERIAAKRCRHCGLSNAEVQKDMEMGGIGCAHDLRTTGEWIAADTPPSRMAAAINKAIVEAREEGRDLGKIEILVRRTVTDPDADNGPRSVVPREVYDEALALQIGTHQKYVRLQDRLDALQEREAAICPEDVGFPEYCLALERKLRAAEEKAAAQLDLVSLIRDLLDNYEDGA